MQHVSQVSDVELFPGATVEVIQIQKTRFFLRMMGSGPPLLLLHGYPQTHVMWHRVASALCRHFTLVMPDLAGYGQSRHDSSLGPGAYAKRPAAGGLVALMRQIGFDSFAVAGHDRGARIAHRMSLDHPDVVRRIAVLDILPTVHRFENIDMKVATKAYHWFFLIQPSPFPERLIGQCPEYFLRHTLNSWARTPEFWHPGAFASYLSSMSEPSVIAATCDDYRASATIDLEHDRADRGRKLGQPLLVLWGEGSPQTASYEVLDVWRGFATDVRGRGLLSGHFLAEEAAEETAAALLEHFSCESGGLAPALGS